MCSYFPFNTLPLKLTFHSAEPEGKIYHFTTVMHWECFMHRCLWINTVNENSMVNAMYKVGDDLRQDMLTLQMVWDFRFLCSLICRLTKSSYFKLKVRIMDKLWRKHGLDLKMVTFSCVPTGPRRGFIVELVTGAETMRWIQVWNVVGGCLSWNKSLISSSICI